MRTPQVLSSATANTVLLLFVVALVGAVFLHREGRRKFFPLKLRYEAAIPPSFAPRALRTLAR